MIKGFSGYDTTPVLTEKPVLPAGGYIVKIMDSKVMNYSWGEVLVIRFDIAEGEFKDFYKREYESQQQEDKKWKGTLRLTIPTDDGSDQDNFKKRIFKTAMTAIEDSNVKFRWEWDESKLKNLIVGALFGRKQWEFNGRTGFYTECRNFVSTDTIKENRYKIPADRLLQDGESSEVLKSLPEGFEEIDDDEIPF